MPVPICTVPAFCIATDNNGRRSTGKLRHFATTHRHGGQRACNQWPQCWYGVQNIIHSTEYNRLRFHTMLPPPAQNILLAGLTIQNLAWVQTSQQGMPHSWPIRAQTHRKPQAALSPMPMHKPSIVSMRVSLWFDEKVFLFYETKLAKVLCSDSAYVVWSRRKFINYFSIYFLTVYLSTHYPTVSIVF